MSVTTRTRAEDHLILRAVGFPVPQTGPLGLLSGKVIAYTDSVKHCGEGKVLGDAEDLIDSGMCPHTYSIRQVAPLSRSTRICLIGDLLKTWTYETTTPGEWRSNVGDVEITEDEYRFSMHEEKLRRLSEFLEAPLIAVDLVSGYAIDLNTAPGLKGCPGVPGWREVAERIAARFKEQQ